MKEVVYIGTELLPPYNEMCAKLVYTLIKNLLPERQYKVLSLPKPGVKVASPANHNYISLPDRGPLATALSLPLYLMKHSGRGKSIIHFMVLAARHTRYVSSLLSFCKLLGVPTVFTLLKKNSEVILCARNASVIVAQTEPVMETTRMLLPEHGNIHQIYGGTLETHHAAVERAKKEVLFVGVPLLWERRDLKQRGVNLLFETIRHFQGMNEGVHFTVLNRALPNVPFINEMARGIPDEIMEIRHESVSDIANYYSSSSMLLCLHFDDHCPDPPLSVIEALACGCPIVTTKFNSLYRLIRDKGAGVTVEPDPSSVAEGIKKVLSDVESYSRNAHRLARENFAENVFSASYNKIYALLDNA
ncbi:MAG TPA: glycosyltransferase [Nitrospirae bacterium]|nr:glycosyl transferases group 1 [bacterium BMS3Abin06]HDH12935.1 glycosyltransferase [Nitrospirota bacterium]HDL19860.1 glycosyltransferase [Nitrospirota bacterium]HDZ01653.1 glycosyltransferase [Nitrospirota bacterium]